MSPRTKADRGARRHARDDTVPLFEAVKQRARGRRGGAPAPFLLLVVIGVIAGVALAYVAQTARAAQLTYDVTALASQQQSLSAQSQKLQDQLNILGSAERISALAQQLGMRPADKWSYVHPSTVAVVSPPGPAEVRSDGSQNGSSGILGESVVNR